MYDLFFCLRFESITHEAVSTIESKQRDSNKRNAKKSDAKKATSRTY